MRASVVLPRRVDDPARQLHLLYTHTCVRPAYCFLELLIRLASFTGARVFVRARVRLCACVCVRVDARQLHRCVRPCMRLCVCVCVCARACVLRLLIRVCVPACAPGVRLYCMYVRSCVCVRAYVCMYHMRVRACTTLCMHCMRACSLPRSCSPLCVCAMYARVCAHVPYARARASEFMDALHARAPHHDVLPQQVCTYTCTGAYVCGICMNMIHACITCTCSSPRGSSLGPPFPPPPPPVRAC
jgi:hypothetical protein